MSEGASPVALVTGAASGIGFATARRLSADGYAILALDRDATGLERLSKAVDGATPVRSMAVDLLDRQATDEAVAQVLERVRRIDVLVNSAGIGVAATTAHTKDDAWDAILEVNATAAFRLVRALLPPMIDAGGGVIVNVASVAALVGVGQRAAYCASKAALLGLTRAVAVDHAAEGIRANAVCPGTVATEWIDKILADAPDPAETRRAMEQRQLDGRMGTPEEVAAGIAFLCSPEARFVNGSAFVMDGGMTAV